MIDRNIANWVIGGPMEATSPSVNLTSGSSRFFRKMNALEENMYLSFKKSFKSEVFIINRNAYIVTFKSKSKENSQLRSKARVVDGRTLTSVDTAITWSRWRLFWILV